jgi:hypothetical protein
LVSASSCACSLRAEDLCVPTRHRRRNLPADDIGRATPWICIQTGRQKAGGCARHDQKSVANALAGFIFGIARWDLVLYIKRNTQRQTDPKR